MGLDSVRTGIDYFDLISQLGVRGSISAGGQFYAPCPLHNDRSPSFSLNIETGLWFCHAEQRGGNFEQLVQEMLGIKHRDAIHWILHHANVIPDIPITPEPEPQQTELETADVTYAGLDADRLVSYWFERGYSWEDADRWGVRYDPIQRQIVIPVRFPFNGPIMGYVRRTVIRGVEPKYRNTYGFDKQQILFGHLARAYDCPVMIVEGPLDAIRADSYGHPAVALLGTYISHVQAQLIAHTARHGAIVALDNDAAGRVYRHEVVRRLEQYRVFARVFRYPDDSDGADIGSLDRRSVYDGLHSAQLSFDVA